MDFILNASRQIYLSKINQAQDYIEKHLEEELHIEQLAKAAAFSCFHFQRIYQQITGESLYTYIKRLRLEKAVFFLRTHSKRSIQDIALSVGFSNQASFAKAIKAKYGMNASQIRTLDDADLLGLCKDSTCNAQVRTNGKVSLEEIRYTTPISFSIEAIEPIKVLYLRYMGAYKGNSDLFMKLFTKLYNHAHSNNHVKKDSKWFVVYHDFGDLTREEQLRLSVCMSITQEAECMGEFGRMEIAGGKYAVGRFLLKPGEYQWAWNYMLSKWLPESGFMPDDRLCFEYYPPQKYEEGKEEKMVEIFIPMTPL